MVQIKLTFEWIIRQMSIILVFTILLNSIIQSSDATTHPVLDTQMPPIKYLKLLDNNTLIVNLSLNFTLDNGCESASEVLLLLNDSEIDRILPENGTQHIEKSVYVSGITPGNYFIQIKQYDFSFNYLLAINYTAALLLTRYGYCSMEVVSRAANWGDDSADILVSGYLFYFGQNDSNFIHVTYLQGNYTVGYYSKNLTDGSILPMATIRAFTVDVREITIFINKGELSINAGPFEVNQKPNSNNGNYLLTPFHPVVILLIIIFTAIVCGLILRKRRKGLITNQEQEQG